MDWCLRLRPTA
uniref:Uncharacterized protein n=1 Tax=Arundo donax TaxID=35708 RepID=A0A0A9H7N5_ARUDO